MVNFRISKMFFLLLALLLVLIFPCDVRAAAQVNGVGMGPSIIDETVKPGETLEQTFSVHNGTDQTINLHSYIQDYRIDNGQWQEVEDPDETWSPMTWATIISAPKTLGPAEQNEVRVKFEVPKNAEMGEHVTYFSAKFMPAAGPGQDQAAQVTVASEIRSLVYIKVTDAEGNLDLIHSWNIDKLGTNFWHFGDPVFTAAATNTGNVHLEAQGTIELVDLIRNQRTELDIPLFNILPHTDKEIQISWPDAPFIGYFNGHMKLTYDGINFEERDFSLVTIPLLTLVGIMTILITIILSIVLYIRSLQKRLADIERMQNNKTPQ